MGPDDTYQVPEEIRAALRQTMADVHDFARDYGDDEYEHEAVINKWLDKLDDEDTEYWCSLEDSTYPHED